ncbi:MAG: hypothetical protein ABI629_13255, partial [bacterium]
FETASTLLVGAGRSAAEDIVKWKWTRELPIALSPFENPLTTTDYALCVFAGTRNAYVADSLLAYSTISNDATSWKATRKGFRYRQRQATPTNGIARIDLSKFNGERMGLELMGKGTGLHLAELPAGVAITAQLRNSSNSRCWSATFDASEQRRPSSSRLSARSIP